MSSTSNDVTAEQKREEMKRLLFGMPAIKISSSEKPATDNELLLSSDDQLGIPHVTDRWSQVLRETLPQCPWMAVQKQVITEIIDILKTQIVCNSRDRQTQKRTKQRKQVESLRLVY